MEPKYYGAAAQYNKPSGPQFNKRLLIIAGGVIGLIILLMIGLAIINAISSGPSQNLAALIAREQSLQSLLEDNKDRIKNGDLAKVNADAIILLTSDTVSLTGHLGRVYSLSAIPPNITAAEADTTSKPKLDSAQQQANFDATYITLLRDKLASSLQLANKALGETGSAGLRTSLQQNIATLQALDNQLAALNQ